MTVRRLESKSEHISDDEERKEQLDYKKQMDVDTDRNIVLNGRLESQIAKLSVPPHEMRVVDDYSNSKNAERHSGEIQAYAKFAGSTWTYYVKKIRIILGREPANPSPKGKNEDLEVIDMNFGPSKVVSRKHAVVEYDLDDQTWNCSVYGRNGIKVDGKLFKNGETVKLTSGSILEVAGLQMMFVLPNAAEQKQTDENTIKEDAIKSEISAAVNDAAEYGDNKKPPYSYSVMIAQAILSSSECMMTLSNIYSWISTHYPYYRTTKSGWQNSIRHNLSLNKAFRKVPRKSGEQGKGMKWSIVPEFREEFIAKTRKTPRKRSPSSPVPLLAKKREGSPSLPIPILPKMKDTSIPAAEPASSTTSARDQTPSTPKDVGSPSTAETSAEEKQMETYKTPTHAALSDIISTHDYALDANSASQTKKAAFGSPIGSSTYPTSSPAPFWKYVAVPNPHDWPQVGSYDTISPYRNPVNSHLIYSQIQQSSPKKIDEQLHDLQGVDLVNGFEGISSWRESMVNKLRSSVSDSPTMNLANSSSKSSPVAVQRVSTLPQASANKQAKEMENKMSNSPTQKSKTEENNQAVRAILDASATMEKQYDLHRLPTPTSQTESASVPQIANPPNSQNLVKEKSPQQYIQVPQSNVKSSA
ncbi:Fork head transcription factor Fkh2 [Schizosaccharomyces pombe]